MVQMVTIIMDVMIMKMSKMVYLNKLSHQMKLFLCLHDGQEGFVHERRYNERRCFLTLFVNEAGER